MGNILLFLHLFGLMIGATGGFATAIIMRRALAMPEDQARVLRGLGPLLANVSGAGLVILWVTGIALVWSVWGGLTHLPWLFWLKAVFILALTACVAVIHMIYARIRRGDMSLAQYLPKIGPVAGLSSLLAVLTAIYAFPLH